MGNLLTKIARLLDETPTRLDGSPPRSIPRRVPRDLRVLPKLHPRVRPAAARPRHALLIDPPRDSLNS